MRSLAQYRPPLVPGAAASVIQIAQRALPIMSPSHRAEAHRLIRSLDQDRQTANAAEEDELDTFYDRAAKAWEHDMAPVREAMVQALRAGDVDALHKFKAQLPDLLEQVNAKPELADVLSRQLFRVAAAAMDEGPATRTANALTASVEQWRSREIFPTDLSSADLRGLSPQLHLRSVFSARTTNADYLQEVDRVVDEMIDGKINQSTGRMFLLRKLKQLGYDPQTGFPQDMANVPPAEKDSLQDLSSRKRLDLMLRTNVEMTRNYVRVLQGNTELARRMWPAWELRRVASRQTPRGTPDSHTVGWLERWKDAAESVAWDGVSKAAFAEDRMIARKDSPIWQKLGDGEGGYTDTLGHNFGPFAFGSGMDQTAVARAEWERLLQEDGKATDAEDSAATGPMVVQLAPKASEVKARFDALSPDLRAKLLERWAA